MAGKGQPKTGGRKKGATNRVTREFRETVRQLLEDNADNVAVWLRQVAEKDPDKALDKLVRLAEFAAPKLSRSEVSAQVENKGIPVVQIVRASEAPPREE